MNCETSFYNFGTWLFSHCVETFEYISIEIKWFTHGIQSSPRDKIHASILKS